MRGLTPFKCYPMKSYIKNLIYSAFVVGLTLTGVIAEYASPTSILNIVFTSPSGEVSLYNIADQLRKEIFVNVEGSTQPIDRKMELKNGSIPLNKLLELIKKTLGYDYSITGNELTFVDPDVRKFGKNYPLDATVDKFVVKAVTAEDAVKILAKEQELSIMTTSLETDPSAKKISLQLANLTVREALNKIVKASGKSGWNSSGGFPKGDEKGLHPIIIITM